MMAKEGIPFTLIGLVVTILLFVIAARWNNWWLFGFCAFFGLLTIFATFFFRDPDRTCDVGRDGLLVSPADGRILSIEKIDNHPYIGGAAIKISIFLSVFDIHVNRIPASGRVEYIKYVPGKFFKAFLDKASEENEHTDIGIVTPSGRKIVVKQIAGIIARRIHCTIFENDSVTVGERFGLIRFGSRTELFVPADTRVEVKVGDHVEGCTTVMGYLNTDCEDAKTTMAVEGENVEL